MAMEIEVNTGPAPKPAAWLRPKLFEYVPIFAAAKKLKPGEWLVVPGTAHDKNVKAERDVAQKRKHNLLQYFKQEGLTDVIAYFREPDEAIVVARVLDVASAKKKPADAPTPAVLATGAPQQQADKSDEDAPPRKKATPIRNTNWRHT